MENHRPALNMVETGTASGPPVLFIHGMMSSNLQWDLHLEPLGRHLRMFLVELPGHGDSPAPDRVDAYGPGEVLAQLDALRRHVGVESWWVVCQSMGAAVGFRHALDQPDHVSGVIFSNARAVFGVSRSASLDIPDTVDGRRDLFFHPIRAKRFPEDLKAKMVAVADAMPGYALQHMRDNVATWASRDDLGSLTMPVLLVNGRWEKRFQPFVQVAADAIADLTVVDLEGGHSINVERPRQFEQAVLDFINRETPNA